ncbi:unnamed protein product [Psylliodes chrysocephalus]|uniref:Major facilitator superfamily (MFS) profile domain-containing protein n=1 Tax=Psylliodes chrysocephalus TaxID=3402493 RepID=A0A9P0CU33_9CUCU|nr:unnamed protein product [Psylliodes chrysocephala]
MESERLRPNFFLYWSVLAVNFLSINTASMFSWASPSLGKLMSNDTDINPLGRPITSFEESIIASICILGAVIGTTVSAMIAEKLGRKRTLIIFSTPFFFCYLIIANASAVSVFYVTRLILGFASGSVLSLLPSYVGEISENSNRGTLGSVFGIMNSLGHFLVFAVGPLVSIKTFAYMLMVPVSLFFVTFIPFIPESPYYFLSKNNIKEAEDSLKKIRCNGNVEKEFLGLQDIVKEAKDNKVTLKDLFSSAATKKGLLVCCGLLFFQQSLGIGVILTYLQPILEASGNAVPSNVASLLIGIIQVISCTAASFVVDSLGRKILLHVSSVGCSISLFALGTYFILNENNYNLESVFWLPLASLIIYYTCFNFGYATIPWSLCGELFSINVKSLCASIASSVCLIVSFLVTLLFPLLRDAFGMGGVFCVFGALGVLASIFVILLVPETKGKSFQEIQNELSGKQKNNSKDAYDCS